MHSSTVSSILFAALEDGKIEVASLNEEYSSLPEFVCTHALQHVKGVYECLEPAAVIVMLSHAESRNFENDIDLR